MIDRTEPTEHGVLFHSDTDAPLEVRRVGSVTRTPCPTCGAPALPVTGPRLQYGCGTVEGTAPCGWCVRRQAEALAREIARRNAEADRRRDRDSR